MAALAFALFAASAVASDRLWAIHSGSLGSVDLEMFKRVADVRVVLEDVRLMVVSAEDLAKFAQSFPGAVSAGAFFTEGQSVTLLSGPGASLAAPTVGKVLLRRGDVALVADASDDALEALAVSSIERVSVPETRIRPLQRSKFPAVARNEKIEALVAAVNIDNVYSTIDHISNVYTTRQSQSTGGANSAVWIGQQLAALGLGVFTFKHRADHFDNVCGELVGENPTSFVIIGAHLDCRNTNSGDSTGRAPGADDNGSGTGTIMEIARGIVQSGLRFTHSLQFCLWSGEEQGLLGSRYYAQQLARNNTNVVAYLNADMVGFKPGSESVLALMSGSASRDLNTLMTEVANQYVPSLEVSRTNACCSDQQSFYEQGFESAGYFEHEGSAGAYSCYHRECDSIDKLDFEQIEIFAKAIIAGFAHLAEPL